MQKNAPPQTSEEIKTVELYVIKNEYKSLIKNDPILKSDFHKLMKSLGSSEPDSAAHCEKIINHLIAEVAETAEDDQRMDDEGPVCENNNPKSCQHLQEHLNLKQDLETYHLTYLADKYRRP